MNIRKMVKLFSLALFALLFSSVSAALTVTGSGSTFEINKGVGFDGSDGADREAVFIAAAKFWADKLVSSVPIVIDAEFSSSLYCSKNSATLGSAGPSTSYLSNADTIGLQKNVWYPTALINAYSGRDRFPRGGDITASFNANLGNADCLASSGWYYGMDGNAPTGKIDFYDVVQHELSHGLGFLSLVNSDGTDQNRVDIFTTFLHDQSTGKDWTSMTNSERNTSVKNTGNVVWSGAGVNTLAGDLTSGINAGKVQMYAPNPYESGSSISHFDNVLSPNVLMEPAYNRNTTSKHSIALLEDIGWSVFSTSNDNDVPSISGQSSLSTNEDTSLTLTLNDLTVSDSDNSYPTDFSLTVNSGINYTVLRNTITPANNYFGTLTVPVIVNDGTDYSDRFNLTVTVNAINDAPVITGSPTTTVAKNSDYSFIPTVSDVDAGDTKTFSIINKPSWATFSTSTGALTGTPSNTDVGTTSGIVITVVDTDNLADSIVSFSIKVTNSNQAPVAEATTKIFEEDSTLTITLTAADTDNDELTYAIVSKPANGELVQLTNNTYRYTPETNYNGTDSFTYKAMDAETDSESVTVTIIINPVNDSPVAQDDIIVLTYSENGRYVLDVLSNDSDVDGDKLTLINTTSSIGELSIESGQLIYQIQGFINGDIELQYAINDGHTSNDNGNNEATVTISFDNNVDASLPVITLPDDIDIAATALFTKVDLGVATAVDSSGEQVPVSLVDAITQFSPGNHLVYWQTQDSNGFSRVATQRVAVQPLINLAKDGQGTEGGHYKIAVHLNGESPTYPITIPYNVTGNAGSDDHNLVSGELVINSGVVGTIEFDTFEDALTEGDESIVISLNESMNLGAKSLFTFTITEDNIAPQVSVTVSQNNEQRTLIDKSLGEVVLSSNVFDANSNNTHRYAWMSVSGELTDTDADETSFTFDPTSLVVGQQTVALNVTDNGDSPLNTEIFIYLDVVESLALLTDIDSDGDLIPDNIEGYSDADADGIADYLDNNTRCNVQPEEVNEHNLYLVETESGVCLRRGVSTAGNKSGSIRLSVDEVSNDDQATNIGGIFDFIVSGLPSSGQSVSVVLPQRLPIPENAVYRKLTSNTLWTEFLVDSNNYVSSAAGEMSYCPAPNDDSWTKGLTAGHWCVQVTIEDGGQNDDDRLANNQVVDPGGVAIWMNTNTLPTVQDEQVVTTQNKSVTIDVLANDSDSDGDSVSIISANVDFGSVTIVEQKLHYQPDTNFFGLATINYGISDGNNGTGYGSVVVNVIENTAPTTLNDNASTDNKTAITINVLANDTDVDNDELTLTNASAEQGSIVISNNMLVYTPLSDFTGIDTVTYNIDDNNGGQSQGQVTITIDEPSGISSSSGGSFGQFILLISCVMFFVRHQKCYLILKTI